MPQGGGRYRVGPGSVNPALPGSFRRNRLVSAEKVRSAWPGWLSSRFAAEAPAG